MNKLKCIKGIADKTNVICLVNDIVKVINIDESIITVIGEFGWCKEHELEFNTLEIAEHFCSVSEH